MARARCSTARPRATCASRKAGRGRCAACGAITERFFQTYFTTYPGKYFTGDGCRRDEDGYYWITGRVDDVINVSGHRMGTAEVESALVAHAKVAEAAVVGFPHDIKGQGIYAYVTLNAGEPEDEQTRKQLVQWVRHEIGPIATPDVIQFAAGPAQDPLGQDHAPHPAQDRRGRHLEPRRYLDARRPGRGRGAGEDAGLTGMTEAVPVIARTIQLSLTPVFLLVAIGNILNLLSTRLSRVVDRSRYLQERHATTTGAEHDMVVLEIRAVDRRFELTSRAIRLLVLAGLAVGMTVAVLFLQEMADYPLKHVAAVLFLIAVALLMGGLALFLAETRAAGEALRIPRNYLEQNRDL